MESAKLRDAMRDDHRRLEQVFDALLNYVHVDDRLGMQAAWRDFERGLTTHLQIEDEVMLPLLERACLNEAATIRKEHRLIRSMLAELGVRLDVHLLREETVEAFVALLRAHAAREDELLYRLAEGQLDEGSKSSILERLAAARRAPHDRAEAPSPRETSAAAE